MKNKKVLKLLSLVAVGGVLVSCSDNKEQVLSYNRPFERHALKAEFISAPTTSQVYLKENGEVIKINDPDDPSVNVLDELVISSPFLSIYYSDSKTSGFSEKSKLSVTGLPKKASLGTITWSSSDPSIATVDENGEVTAVSEGLAIITATSSVGKTATSKVYVNNTNVLMSKVAKSAAKILERQNDASFNRPTVVKLNQIYNESRIREGVLISSSKSSQTIWAASKDSYFRIVADDENVLTTEGSIVQDNTSYVFYTTKDYSSYIFSTSNGKSNYMTLDQSSLVDRGLSPFDGLAEVLQSFFVSGSKIMTSQFTNILGQEQLVSSGYSGPKYKGSFGEESGQFAFSKLSQGGGRVGAEDAQEMDIPVGTSVTIKDDIRYLFADNLLKTKIIDEVLAYKVGDVSYEDHINVVYNYYSEDVDIWWPEVSQFSKVESIFDL